MQAKIPSRALAKNKLRVPTWLPGKSNTPLCHPSRRTVIGSVSKLTKLYNLISDFIIVVNHFSYEGEFLKHCKYLPKVLVLHFFSHLL